jgi:capsular polysaccharide biosynthesis protein
MDLAHAVLCHLELARDIANKTADVFSAEVVTKILDVENVQISETAVMSQAAS